MCTSICTCSCVMAPAIVYDVNVSMTFSPTVRSICYKFCIILKVVDECDFIFHMWAMRPNME